MQQSGYPTKIPLPWASSAGASYIETIPTASQQGTSTPAKASFTDGFPPATFGASGTPPYGQDFNGILNQLSAGLQAAQAGAVPQFDATFATNIGGYPTGCILASTTLGKFWVSTADGNTTDPDGTSPQNWQSLFIGLAPLASPAFTGSPTAPTPAAASNNTQIPTTAWVTSNFAKINGLINGGVAYATSTTLTASDAHKIIFLTGTNAATFTLPSASAAAAYALPLVISNQGTGTLTIAAPSGDSLDLVTAQLKPGQVCALVNDGGSVWHHLWQESVTINQFGNYGGSSNLANSTSVSTTVSFTTASKCIILVNSNGGSGGNPADLQGYSVSATGVSSTITNFSNWAGTSSTTNAIGVGMALFTANENSAVTITANASLIAARQTLVGLTYICIPVA